MIMRESYLLKNADKMIIYDNEYQPSGCGTIPEKRDIEKHINYGVVVVDKPPNPSSHEVDTWVKNIIQCEKTGHSGTLDPNVSGVLPICLNKATPLLKVQQSEGKVYVCEIKLNKKCNEKDFMNAVEKLTGHLYQRPPLECAVKRELRLRWIYSIEMLEFYEKTALFIVKCEAGSYIRTLWVHLGLMIGCGAEMGELRRIKSGYITEDRCVTLHDLKDAFYQYRTSGDDSVIRKVVKPLELLLVGLPRIIIKDSSVSSICHGGQLTIKGIYKYDENLEPSKDVILITAYGEAVALAKSLVYSEEIKTMNSGFVTKTERVIMERELYPRCWGIMEEYQVYFKDKELV